MKNNSESEYKEIGRLEQKIAALEERINRLETKSKDQSIAAPGGFKIQHSQSDEAGIKEAYIHHKLHGIEDRRIWDGMDGEHCPAFWHPVPDTIFAEYQSGAYLPYIWICSVATCVPDRIPHPGLSSLYVQALQLQWSPSPLYPDHENLPFPGQQGDR